MGIHKTVTLRTDTPRMVIRKTAIRNSHTPRTAMDKAVILRGSVPDRVPPAAMDSRAVRHREIILAPAMRPIPSTASRHRDRDRPNKTGLPPDSVRRSRDNRHRPAIASPRDRASPPDGLLPRDRARRQDSPGKVHRSLYPGREAHLAAGRKHPCWDVL